MSVSVGSASTSLLASWQQMLQAGGATSSTKGQSFDPLAALIGTGQSDASPAGSGGLSATKPFDQGMMAQLIALQQQASASGTTNTDDNGSTRLFAKLDTDGSGAISKSELEAAASKKGIRTSISDAVFDKIDADGDGAVTQAELAKADRPGGGHHGSGVGTADGSGDGDSSRSDGEGTKTTTTVNADKSVTTTITYADGSSASTTSAPPAAANDGSKSETKSKDIGKDMGNGGADLFRQLAELQKQLISAATSTLSTVI